MFFVYFLDMVPVCVNDVFILSTNVNVVILSVSVKQSCHQQSMLF